MEKTWHKKAILLYFGEHIKIIDIAEQLGVTRQTVSVFLQSLPEWKQEAEYRKNESEKRRKTQKQRWEQYHRMPANLKREHEQAVRELSAERYH